MKLLTIDGKSLDERQPYNVVGGIVVETVCKCSIRFGACEKHK